MSGKVLVLVSSDANRAVEKMLREERREVSSIVVESGYVASVKVVGCLKCGC